MFKPGLLIVALALTASAALAQDQPTADVTRTTMQDWVVECLEPAVDALKCQATYTVLFGPDRSPVFVTAISGVPGQPVQMTMALPLNIELKKGLVISGADKTVTLAFNRCTPNGCTVEMPLTSEVYAIMSATEAGTATVVRHGGQEFKIPFSFKGFKEALSAMSARNAPAQ